MFKTRNRNGMRSRRLACVLALVMTLAVSLAACGGGETAEQAVSNMLDGVKAADQEKVSKYTSYDELIDESDADEQSESRELMEKIFSRMEYKIVSSKEDGDEAVVTAEITNVDMASVIQEMFSQMIGLVFSGIDEAEMDAKIQEIFTELIGSEDAKTVTNTVEIELEKKDGGWKIEMDSDLVDAILGGMISAGEDMNNSLSGLGS